MCLTERQESSPKTHISPDPFHQTFQTKPLVHFFIYAECATQGVPIWRSRSRPATPPSRTRTGRAQAQDTPEPASAHRAPRAEGSARGRASSQGSRCAEEPAKGRSISRHQWGKHFCYLHRCRTAESLLWHRARPWNKADPWKKPLLPLNTCLLNLMPGMNPLASGI